MEDIPKVLGEKEKLEFKKEAIKSWVRVVITYIAALFLFVGGTLFILYLLNTKQVDKALNLFNTLLPVAAAIISYWFAGRSIQGKENNK